MNKSKRHLGLLLAAVVVFMGAGAILVAGSASAAAECWQVDCNTCCKNKGKTICTQRACP